jgi:DNA-directed RNA polymerase I, II, and III subunit RPABC1
MEQKAYEVCIEMFEQRGYEILQKDDDRILALKEDGEYVCAFLILNTKFNVDKIQECIGGMKQMDVYHGVIIYKDTVTPIAKKVVEESKEILIELFNVEEMQYNITKHQLVPKHELMYKKDSIEAKEFKKNKYPIISKSDPVSRFYGYNIGDVIMVTRKNGYIMFRIVGK